ncbi:MAG TPA: DNA topoisomerase III [Burkholderiales bacterium]|nr:DNA topoisomerase III [Burkholderiales bacterium]
MAKQLIIAEKPSVANDIARALGGFTRRGEYFESDDYVLSSAIGHLLELVAPDEYEVKRGKWSFAHLPVIPPHFDLKPIERSEDRLKVLLSLIKRKDVAGLINACDAGREGELIFRYIVRHARAKKPIQRLWLQSMTPAAIREGFEQLRTDRELQPLADAAVSRSESDWLVGINGTRAMTAFNSKDGGFYKTTVGRVQTPTLAILVERESRIKGFVVRDYWEVHGTFAGRGGEYPGRWFDEHFERRDDEPDARAERIWDHARAEAIRTKCLGKPGIVTEESKPTTQAPPLLYDLTSLQREANGRFGFSARTTLSIAQALYEKHKVLTYPRTDSRALPEDYVGTVKKTLEMLRGKAATTRAYAPFADKVLAEGWVKPNKRVFNNEKISDHFAIIPTLQAPKHLSEVEQKLYDLVTKRFLAVFFPAAEYLVTIRITRVEKEPFKSEGRVMLNAGWLAVYGKEAEDPDTPTLAPVPDGKVKTVAIEVQANQTKPPARYTEATLLTAMEGAGKLVDDEELREAMREKGLGTPATRASIIEGLIFEDYVHRVGRELHPTAKAFDLLYALGKFGIDELRSPELTGAWEFKLKQMEHGQLRRDEFMEHIVETTRDLVERIKRGTLADDTIATLAVKCPKCGGTVNENYKKFQCANCDFAIWKIIAGRRIEGEEAEALIKERAIGPLQGFRSRIGRPFAAMIKLRDDFTTQLDFGQSAQDERDAEPVDFSGKAPLGPCPKCGARVFDHELAYVCERAVGPGRTCDFRSGKIILQRPIEPEQMVKLLATGRTDLLHRFISKKGRPFSAFLVRQPDGKVGFEFAPRARAKPAAGAPADTKDGGKAPAVTAKARATSPDPTARDAAERNVYKLKPGKGEPPAPKQSVKTAAASTARVAAKRTTPAKKIARKSTARKPATAKKQKRAA